MIATIPRSSGLDVEDAVIAAESAQAAWGARSIEERAEMLDAIADVMEAHADDLAKLEALDTGKPWDVARHVDIDRCVRNFRFFAELGRTSPQQTFAMDDAMNHVLRKPIGVVGLISPWNLPLYLLTWKVAPALLMGNAIVAKPSEITPLTAHRFSELALEAGLPAGLLNVLHGLGPEVGQAIVEHPRIAAISFTGGTSTGRIVAATAAPMFKKLSLELGGKNATVVLDDADLDAVLPGVVRAGFLNSGQICLCGSRVLVHASLYDDFLTRFVDAVKHFPIGPVISEAHRDKVEGYLALAVEEGGEVLTGGTRGPGTGFHLARGHRGPVPEQPVRHRGNLRPGGDRASFRDRGRSARHRQRHRVRFGRFGVDRRRRARPSLRGTDGHRHGVGQHLAAPRFARSLWRREALWRGPRGR